LSTDGKKSNNGKHVIQSGDVERLLAVIDAASDPTIENNVKLGSLELPKYIVGNCSIYFEITQQPLSFFLIDFKNAVTFKVLTKWGSFESLYEQNPSAEDTMQLFYSFYDDTPPSEIFEKLVLILGTTYLEVKLDTFVDVRSEFNAAMSASTLPMLPEASDLLAYICENSHGKKSHQVSQSEKLKLIGDFNKLLAAKTAS